MVIVAANNGCKARRICAALPSYVGYSLNKTRFLQSISSCRFSRFYSSSSRLSNDNGGGSSRSCSSNGTAGVYSGKDVVTTSLPTRFLRLNDSSNYNPHTLQRNDVVFDSTTGKVMTKSKSSATTPKSDNNAETSVTSCCFDNQNKTCSIHWCDNTESTYTTAWINQQESAYKGCWSERQPWMNLSENIVRSSTELCKSFEDVVFTDHANVSAIHTLYKFGILLVTNTPIHDDGAGIAALGASLSGGSIKNESSLVTAYRNGCRVISVPRGTDGPLQTLYGTVWSTTSSGMVEGTSTADSAYSHEALPLHTDMTYRRDPPGLQIFTMIRPSEKGGESVFGDGLAAAERLRQSNPRAFETLSNTVRRYRCIDYSTGWHLEASGPVINIEHGEITTIRHNDLDRLPDLPPQTFSSDEIDKFYVALDEAHHAWDEILNSDDFRLVIALQPGDTLVVANQRCFHGRHSFQTGPNASRSVAGCYIGQDELLSRLRMEGYYYP